MGAMNMRRIINKIPIVLILFSLIILVVGCGSASDETGTLENQMATVQRGNLTIDITAAGNLALSRTEDLAFEIAGTVEEVLVEEGDSVEEGQVLARLDTSEWEDYLETLEAQLTTAERTLTTKERAVTTAERTLTTKERALTTAGVRSLRTCPDRDRLIWCGRTEGNPR